MRILEVTPETKKCAACNGTGKGPWRKTTCFRCNGNGALTKSQVARYEVLSRFLERRFE